MSLRAGILLLAALLTAPALAAAEQGGRPAAALVLFLDAESDAALPAAPALLREAARQALVAALAAPGRRLCAGDEVEGLLADARVRSRRGLSREIVAALGKRCGAEQVIIARLACGQGKLFLALRALAAADGRLLQVAIAEQDLAGGDDWRRAIGDASLELAACWQEPAPAAAAACLLVLPARGPGVDPLLLSLVEESLLAELLAQGRWRIPDPALLVSALRQAGIHPASIGVASRRALASELGAESLLRLTVSEYGADLAGAGLRGAGSGDAMDEDGRRGSASQRAGASPAARQIGRPLLATLEFVAAESGLLRLAAEQYLPALSLRGSFGRARRLPWAARCAELTAPLAAAFAAASAPVEQP